MTQQQRPCWVNHYSSQGIRYTVCAQVRDFDLLSLFLPSSIWMATTPPLLQLSWPAWQHFPLLTDSYGSPPFSARGPLWRHGWPERPTHYRNTDWWDTNITQPWCAVVCAIVLKCDRKSTSAFLSMCRTWRRSTRKHCSCWGSSRPSFWMTSWSSGRDGNSWQATGARRREAWTSCSPGEFSSTSHQDHSPWTTSQSKGSQVYKPSIDYHWVYFQSLSAPWNERCSLASLTCLTLRLWLPYFQTGFAIFAFFLCSARVKPPALQYL